MRSARDILDSDGSPRPRVLVVTPRFPYPVVGGDRLRIVSVCRELAKDCELTLASLCATRSELTMQIPSDSPFQSVHRVYLPRWRQALRTLAALASRLPLEIAYFRSRALERLVSMLVPDHDVLLAHLIRAAPYVLGHAKPTVIEMTDAISMNYARVRERGAGIGRVRSMIFGVEAARIRGYEVSAARRADLSIFVSDVDRDHLLANDPALREKLVVFSNGVDSDALPFSFAATGSRICFIGNMMTLQNLDAAHFFARSVFPLIRRQLPDAAFEIVGRIRRGGGRCLAGIDGVHVVGAVPSIAPAVRGAAVGVCPVRLGAGIQNKVLEYMALGLPVVSSSVGLEGLRARPGIELLVGDSPEEIATCVVRLLRDRDFARQLAGAARRYVVERHSWPALLAPLREAVTRLSIAPARALAAAGQRSEPSCS